MEKYRKGYSAIVGIIEENGALAPLCTLLRYAKRQPRVGGNR